MGSLKLIWTLCLNKEPVALCKGGRSHTLVQLVFKVQQLLYRITGWLAQTPLHAPLGDGALLIEGEGSRWSPEVCFALFLLSSMSGNLLKSVNWQWKMSVVWRPNRWGGLQRSHGERSGHRALPGRASPAAGGQLSTLLLLFLCCKQKQTKKINKSEMTTWHFAAVMTPGLSAWNYSSSQVPGLSWRGKSCPSKPPFQLGDRFAWKIPGWGLV